MVHRKRWKMHVPCATQEYRAKTAVISTDDNSGVISTDELRVAVIATPSALATILLVIICG